MKANTLAVIHYEMQLFADKRTPRGGGGYSLVRAKWGCAASQSMFFRIFALKRVLNLPFFVLIRVSFINFCLKQDVFSWTINSKVFTSS